MVEANGPCDDPSHARGLLAKCAQCLEDFFGSAGAFAFGNVIHRHGDLIHHDKRNNIVFFPVEGAQNICE